MQDKDRELYVAVQRLREQRHCGKLNVQDTAVYGRFFVPFLPSRFSRNLGGYVPNYTKNKAYHQLAAFGKSKCMTEWNVAKCGGLLVVACSFCESVPDVFCKLYQHKQQCSGGKAKAKTRKAKGWFCNMERGNTLAVRCKIRCEASEAKLNEGDFLVTYRNEM